MRVAPPLSERRGSARGSVRSTTKCKCKRRTNETPEFLTYYVAQQRPILYNRKVVVLPRFQQSSCSKGRVNLGFCHPSNKRLTKLAKSRTLVHDDQVVDRSHCISRNFAI